MSNKPRLVALCGHTLVSGGRCSQWMASDRDQCGRHPRRDPAQGIQLPDIGCHMRTDEINNWHCDTHGGDAWEAAVAMGARLPCRIVLTHRRRRELAEKADLDLFTATLLMQDDPTAGVLVGLASNIHCPLPILEQLGQHPAVWVRAELLSNPRVPPNIRKCLEEDRAVLDYADMVADIMPPTKAQPAASNRESAPANNHA